MVYIQLDIVNNKCVKKEIIIKNHIRKLFLTSVPLMCEKYSNSFFRRIVLNDQ